MIELTTKAENYAAEKTNELITNAIAQAYADGYRDGYKDREEEIPVDLRDKKTEYVDLGLPSGTLWSKSYEVDRHTMNGEDDFSELLYLSFEEAKRYKIPTIAQCKELLDCCMWEVMKDTKGFYNRTDCIGLNGNIVSFYPYGYKASNNKGMSYAALMWAKSDTKGTDKDVLRIDAWHNFISTLYSGYKLPIRLVRTK